MVEIHIFGQKLSFCRPNNIFLLQKLLFGQISTEIFAFLEKIFFLVKIFQKSRHGCVKSEHVLLSQILGAKAPLGLVHVMLCNVNSEPKIFSNCHNCIILPNIAQHSQR